MSFLKKLNWRYATKAFDTQKKVSEENLNKILEAIRLAPTSFGLQPFRVEVITDQKLKDLLKTHGWNQPQYSTASHVLCFVALTEVKNRITQYLDLASNGDAEARKKLEGYEKMMRGAMEPRSVEDLKIWATKQAYIALGFAMAACAELEIDSCPMEGFIPAEVDKVLGLKSGEFSAVMLPIGFREASANPRGKVRFDSKNMFSFR